MTHDQDPKPAPAESPPQGDRVEVPVIHSRDLLRGRAEVLIEHAGQIYRLRMTRSGKLILQK